MLVLTRKKLQTIHIGEHIVVKVIQTGRKSVKIGIEAPGNVSVLRSELRSDWVRSHPATPLRELLLGPAYEPPMTVEAESVNRIA
jgi:carbon storage regulator CsrA